MRLPPKFSDSYTTHEATISVTVGKPFGESGEEVLVQVDCNGVVSLDATEMDAVIEMMEAAKANMITRHRLTRENLHARRVKRRRRS